MGFFDKIFGKSAPKNPEDEFLITITDEFVRVEHPRRKTEQIAWTDINEIRFINTAAGPMVPDVWLALLGKNGGCLIPQGAKGCETIYETVSKYENFNFENVIKSMSSTGDEHFILWQRK